MIRKSVEVEYLDNDIPCVASLTITPETENCYGSIGYSVSFVEQKIPTVACQFSAADLDNLVMMWKELKGGK